MCNVVVYDVLVFYTVLPLVFCFFVLFVCFFHLHLLLLAAFKMTPLWYAVRVLVVFIIFFPKW